MKKVVAALVLTTCAGAVFAQQALKPEEMIKYRKAGYSFMAWNMGKIKANLEGSYNKEQVVAAANLVAATANSGMGALFGAGYRQGCRQREDARQAGVLQGTGQGQGTGDGLHQGSQRVAKGGCHGRRGRGEGAVRQDRRKAARPATTSTARTDCGPRRRRSPGRGRQRALRPPPASYQAGAETGSAAGGGSHAPLPA